MTGTVDQLARPGVGGSYGFIVGDDSRRYFFLSSAMDFFGPTFSELGVGERVEFTPISAPKGPRAIEVRVIHD